MGKRFRGWGILSAVSLAGILSYTLMEAASTTCNSLMFSYGNVAFTATQYGLAFTAWGLMQGLPAPFIGKMVQKYGAKKVMLTGQAGLAILCLFLARYITVSAFAFILIFGVIGGLFDNTCSQVPTGTILNSWFRRKNGQAIIIRGILAGVAGIIIPYVFKWVMYDNAGNVNWLNGYYLVGACSVASFIITWIFVVNKPEDVGQVPDGISEDTIESEQKEQKISARIYRIAVGENVPYKEAVRHSDFWKFCIMSAVGFFAIMSSVSPGVVHLYNAGFTYDDVVATQSLGAVVSIGAMFLMMWLVNKVEPVRLFSIFLLLYAVSALCYADGDAVWKYAVFFYATKIITSAANLLPAAYLANYYGLKTFPVVQGTALLCAGLFSSTNSTIAGLIADSSQGSYTVHFYLCAALAILAAICGFTVNYKKGAPQTAKFSIPICESFK